MLWAAGGAVGIGMRRAELARQRPAVVLGIPASSGVAMCAPPGQSLVQGPPAEALHLAGYRPGAS